MFSQLINLNFINNLEPELGHGKMASQGNSNNGNIPSSPSSSDLPNIGGPNYKAQWSDRYNSAWAFEDCDAIAIREGTVNLFEHLVASKVQILVIIFYII